MQQHRVRGGEGGGGGGALPGASVVVIIQYRTAWRGWTVCGPLTGRRGAKCRLSILEKRQSPLSLYFRNIPVD